VFVIGGGLSRHRQSKHKGVMYDCYQCDYRVTPQNILTCHIQSKHEEIHINVISVTIELFGRID
jgi:hypothetical protein